EPLRRWKTIWVDEPEDDGYAFTWPRASVWSTMVDHSRPRSAMTTLRHPPASLTLSCLVTARRPG
ncbi:hypothetical protein, partial [Streptomyces eurythermus]|uniref:hypothetical protein n=1 Tax=Streptomyces eurythermus TaxID=42237 RepID=UPI0034086E1F